MKHILSFVDGPNELTIHDARALMKESGLTPGQFFAKYGFVIIPHKTSMEPHEWEDSDKLRRVYDAEIKKLVKNELEMPDATYDSTGTIMLRGPPLPNATRIPKNFYATGIHSDYPLDEEGYLQRARLSDQKDQHDAIAADAYEKTFPRDGIEGYIRLNVWRPIKPMREPLKHKPLAWLDPNTITADETILHSAQGVATRGNSLRIKHSPHHRWYYFPDHTVDEVIVFRVFEHWKGAPPIVKGDCAPPSKLPVFHVAIDDPTMTATSESRSSTEYRPWLFLPKKRFSRFLPAARRSKAVCTQQ